MVSAATLRPLRTGLLAGLKVKRCQTENGRGAICRYPEPVVFQRLSALDCLWMHLQPRAMDMVRHRAQEGGGGDGEKSPEKETTWDRWVVVQDSGMVLCRMGFGIRPRHWRSVPG
jgi:hypothetical protein